MRVNLYDNGLQARTGHHFDFCLRIAAALRRRGATVRMHGAAFTRPEVETAFTALGCSYTGLFSHHAYAPIKTGTNPVDAVNNLALSTAAELSQTAQADLHAFLTLKPLEFLSASLSSLAGPALGYVHGEPSYQGLLSVKAWAQASDNLRSHGLRFRLGAVDPVIGDFLATHLRGIDVESFPIAMDGPARDAPGAGLRTLGFFGSQRDERGKDLLVPLIEHLLALGYRIVLHDTNGQFTNSNANPNLTVLSSFVADLQQEMLACDAIICPMLRESYQHRISGVACNALSAGLPLVLPAGTLTAARFHRLGSMQCYEEHTPEGIVQAIERLAGAYEVHAAKAVQAALQWRAAHGTEHFVDKIIETVNTSRAATPD